MVDTIRSLVRPVALIGLLTAGVGFLAAGMKDEAALAFATVGPMIGFYFKERSDLHS